MSIAPVSQFFILSPRGDTIISKDYRGDAVAGTTDTFFRKVGEQPVEKPESVCTKPCLSAERWIRLCGVCRQRRTPTTIGSRPGNNTLSFHSRQILSQLL